MTAGFRDSASQDFDTLFQPLGVGTPTSAQGFRNSSNADVNTLYLPLAQGLQGPTVGFRNSSSVDMGNIFAANTALFTTANEISSTRTTSWATLIQHEFTVTFTSAQAATDFFFYSGQIQFSGSRTGGTGSSHDTDWSNILTNMGTVSFQKSNTVYSGTGGTTHAVGFSNLTSVYQTCFTAFGVAPYAADEYSVQAKADSTTVIHFLVNFNAGDSGTVGSSVDGTIVSQIADRRYNNTSYFVIPAPSYSNITLLTAGS